MSRIKQRVILTRDTGGPVIRVRRPRRGPAPKPAEPPEASVPEAGPSAGLPEPEVTPPQPEAASPEPEAALPETKVALPETKVAPPEPEAAHSEPEAASPQPPAQPAGAEQPDADAPPPSSVPETAVNVDRRRPRLVGVRTTGVLEVPQDTVIRVAVAISSFAETEHTADVWIRRVQGRELETVFFRSLTVPAGGAQGVTVDGLGGETIQIDVQLSSDLLVPTAAITQYFPADGAIVVLLYKSPGDFIPI